MRSGWIDRKDCGSTPSFAANSWRLIYHDHVTPGSEFTQNLQAFWLRVIEAQAPLISVHAQEPERFSVEEWWSPGARVIAGPRTLDLEDLGAHVGEQHRRKWTCDRGGKIEDADPGEKIEALTGLDLREASEGQACISTTRQHGNSVPHRTHQRPATSAALTARAFVPLAPSRGQAPCQHAFRRVQESRALNRLIAALAEEPSEVAFVFAGDKIGATLSLSRTHSLHGVPRSLA